MSSFAYTASPYYIYAPASLDEGRESVCQLHVLCSQLNQMGYAAYLVEAPMTDGRLWTPVLTTSQMAAHYRAHQVPISIFASSQRQDSPYPGVRVGFQSELTLHTGKWGTPGTLQYEFDGPIPGTTIRKQLAIGLPWADPDIFSPPPSDATREGALIYTGWLDSLHRKPRPEHEGLTDLSPVAENPLSPIQRAELLRKARTLYAYARGTVTAEARLCGCDVVYISNDWTLQVLPTHILDTYPAQPQDGKPDFRAQFLAHIASAPDALQQFIATTQQMARQLPWDKAWSVNQTHQIEAFLPASPDTRAAQADARAYQNLIQQYRQWAPRATPTEVYADICAEYITRGQVSPVTVHLFGHGRPAHDLANAIDDLGRSWLPPQRIVVHAPYPCPVAPEDLGNNVIWLDNPELLAETVSSVGTEHSILLDAGTRLEPYTLLELTLAAQLSPQAELVYADEDVPDAQGNWVPFLKGSANIEWLRSTNYLGGVVAVRTPNWLSQPDAYHYVSAYRLALAATAVAGPQALGYVDKILSHAPRTLAEGREQEEFNIACTELARQLPSTQVTPTDTVGCWRVSYPDTAQPVSMVVPTGKQLGYLRSLLASIAPYAQGAIAEVVLVVQACDLAATQDLVQASDAGWLSVPITWVTTPDGPYHHARTLNAGLHAATHEFVLICDDDVELIERGSIEQLRRLLQQSDVAMVAPRQVLQIGSKPLLLAGPCAMGEGGMLLNYTGEQQGLLEKGLFNRLQLTQDVAGVHASCFMTRKSAVQALGGWDEEHAYGFATVADLGYRFLQAGQRLVWTPQASVLHAGGVTMRQLKRDRNTELALLNQLIAEQACMAERWLPQAHRIGLYNRHWSGRKAYELDADLVVNWVPARKDRPRALAQPISSGSGQYRVVEPLNALQMQSLAETSFTNPLNKKRRRVLSPLDIVRTRPDRVIVQHSIADEDIAQLKAIRASCPEVFIVQLMDDLTSDLPKSHPNYVFGQREGHSRTLQALALSDRLVVSTQPLADYYQAFCSDVRVVPNTLDERAWGHFFRTPKARRRLRVGWAGAAQHQGDLKLIESVVAELAPEVDFIFMGMCPDELRPHIHEFHSFVSYKDYPAKLASLDLDIALAPLEDNPFNACKSNLRLLEYGAMGWPVVCSDVYPFRTDSPPVDRVSNDPAEWLQAIRRLMADPSLRADRGAALNHWLRDHYMLENQATTWYHAIFD